VSRKFDATKKDPRGRSAALESYRAFRDGSKNTEYSQMVDVYAFAVVMYEMTSHRPPWDAGVGESEIRENVCRGQRPAMPDVVADGGPRGWTELMESCWHQDARQRPTFAEARPALVRMRDANAFGDGPTPREGAVSLQEARRGSDVVELDTYIRLDDEDAEEDAAAEEAFRIRLARI
jgi:serine/threonine protein kinase